MPAPPDARSTPRWRRPIAACWTSPSASSTAPMLGVVNLDKPVGPTSHDMVGLMRRLTGTRRIGHAGHAGPARLRRASDPRRRRHPLQRGADRGSQAVRRRRSASASAPPPMTRRDRSTPTDAPLPSDEAIADALAGFVGTFEQRPPAFSARKVAGRTAYRAARAGEPIDLPPRPSPSTPIELLEVEPRRVDG